jgi:hypothetical protein
VEAELLLFSRLPVRPSTSSFSVAGEAEHLQISCCSFAGRRGGRGGRPPEEDPLDGVVGGEGQAQARGFPHTGSFSGEEEEGRERRRERRRRGK